MCLYFFDLHVLRRLSTFGFGLESAGSLCDGAVGGRAQWIASARHRQLCQWFYVGIVMAVISFCSRSIGL